MRFLGGVKMLFEGQSDAKFSTIFCRNLVIKKMKSVFIIVEHLPSNLLRRLPQHNRKFLRE